MTGGPAGAAAGAAAGSLAGQMAERGVNHSISDRSVRSDLGSLKDIQKNPAREIVRTVGVTAVAGAMGAIGVGTQKISSKMVIDGTKLVAESGVNMASKAVTKTVVEGTTAVVERAVKKGMDFAGKSAVEALAQEADKMEKNKSREVKDISEV